MGKSVLALATPVLAVAFPSQDVHAATALDGAAWAGSGRCLS
jgi:hypothetical protein